MIARQDKENERADTQAEEKDRQRESDGSKGRVNPCQVKNIANLPKYSKIHTKYIQNIYNTYKMAA